MKRWWLMVAVAAAAAGCAYHDVNVDPAAPGEYRQTNLRFQFQENGGKESGRLIWKAREDRSHMIILGPLNQSLAEIFSTGEEVILLNRRRRLYWRGQFREFLDYYWQLDFTLAEIDRLLWNAEIPDRKPPDLEIDLVRREEGGGAESVAIRHGGSRLSLSVTKMETRSGNFSSLPELSGMEPVAIEEVFADD